MIILPKYNSKLFIKHRAIALVIFFAAVSVLKFSPELSSHFLLDPFKVLIAHADDGDGGDSGGSDGGDSGGSSGSDSGGSSGSDSGGSAGADSGGSSDGATSADGSGDGNGGGGNPPAPPAPPVPPIAPPVPPVPPVGPPLGPPPPPTFGGCCGTPILTLFSNKLPPFTDITLASYVYLSQLPYTGMNNLDTIFYFAILLSISGVSAYKLTRRKKQKYE